MPSVLHVVFSNISASLGIVFNGYILFVFIWNRKIYTPNRLLLLHLAIVDVLFSLVILFYNTTLGSVLSQSSDSLSYKIIPKNFHLPATNLCEAHGFLWTVLPIVMVWNVCALSFDRYAAIYTPLHYSRLVNVKRVSYFACASWTLGVLLALPPLLNVCPYVFWDARWACAANCLPNENLVLWYPITYIVFAVALPLSFMLYCNLHMLIMSRYHRHSIVSAIYDVTVNAHASITHQRNPCYLSKFKGKNAFFTIIQIVGSIVLLTVPYYGIFVWESTNGSESNPILISISTFFLTCTPPVNAYVYGIKSRILRQTLKRLLHQHFHQTGTRINIKRRLSEIFSDPSARPPLSRRLSAPADYGRTSRSSTRRIDVPTTQDVKPSTKPPFTRSISLPVTTQSFLPELKPLPQPPASESRRNSKGQLIRGESAPEDCIAPCEDVKDFANATCKEKRQMYARSSSFPLERETFRSRRRQRLEEIRKASEAKFESICVRVEEDQIGEEQISSNDETCL